jgi:DUF1009 family protein
LSEERKPPEKNNAPKPSLPDPVGFIAGNLSLPVLAARKVKEEGRTLIVVGISGETDEELKRLSDHYEEISLGSLVPLADFFLQRNCTTVAMAGGVSRDNIVKNYRPDAEAVKIMEKLPNFHTDTILRAFGDWLENRGLTLVGITDIVPDILVKPGFLGKTRPDPDLLEDLQLAFRFAKELGRLDIGQTVVVSDKIAVALEGADGTDATIKRGASLCLKPVAVAKVLKPNQDRRLDLPVIGPSTLELLRDVGAGGLALDAAGLIVLEEETCVKIADDNKITLVAWNEPPDAKKDQNKSKDPNPDPNPDPDPSSPDPQKEKQCPQGQGGS